MTDEIFTTELETNGALTPLLTEQIAWEMDRQARQNSWERKNDKRERPEQYRKVSGVVTELPMKPREGKKSKKS